MVSDIVLSLKMELLLKTCVGIWRGWTRRGVGGLSIFSDTFSRLACGIAALLPFVRGYFRWCNKRRSYNVTAFLVSLLPRIHVFLFLDIEEHL